MLHEYTNHTAPPPKKQLRAFRDKAEAEARSELASPSPSPATLSLQNLRDDELALVRATAAAWRLGHAQEDGGGGGAGKKGIRVWLPPVRLNSTHDVSAGMSVAPESAVGDGDGGAGGAGGAAAAEGDGGGGGAEGGGGGFDAGEFRCRVGYTVLSSGVVTVESDVSMPEHWPTIPRCVCVCVDVDWYFLPGRGLERLKVVLYSGILGDPSVGRVDGNCLKDAFVLLFGALLCTHTPTFCDARFSTMFQITRAG